MEATTAEVEHESQRQPKAPQPLMAAVEKPQATPSPDGVLASKPENAGGAPRDEASRPTARQPSPRQLHVPAAVRHCVASLVDDVVAHVRNATQARTLAEELALQRETGWPVPADEYPPRVVLNLCSSYFAQRDDVAVLCYALMDDRHPVGGAVLDRLHLLPSDVASIAKAMAAAGPRNGVLSLVDVRHCGAHTVRSLEHAGVLSTLHTLVLDGVEVGDSGALRLARALAQGGGTFRGGQPAGVILGDVAHNAKREAEEERRRAGLEAELGAPPECRLRKLSLGCLAGGGLTDGPTGDGCPTGGCGIGPKGARALAEALETNSTLRHLSLSGNGAVGDLGAFCMADALVFNRTLRRLDLRGAGIGAAGARQLTMIVQGAGNRVLRLLDVGDNPCGRGAAREIDDVLASSAARRERLERAAWRRKPVSCRLGCDVAALMPMQQFRHETRECELRVMPCPQGCGQPGLRVRDHERHLEEECLLRTEECPLGCGEPAMLASDLSFHVASYCMERPVKCGLGCGAVGLVERTRGAHERDECPNTELTCPIGCGNTVRRSKLPVHDVVCPERPVPCPLGAGCEGVTFATSKRHEFRECPMRHVWCAHGCRDPELVARDQKHHEEGWGVCAKRRAPCRFGCGKTVVGAFYRDHEERCGYTWVACRYHCGKMIDRRLIEPAVHEEACEMRVDECPLDCGIAPIPPAEMPTHLEYDCVRRPVRCALRCGAAPEAQHLAAHESAECTWRIVSCACGRRMQQRWVRAHQRAECAVTVADPWVWRHLLGGKWPARPDLAMWAYLGGLLQREGSDGASTSFDLSDASGDGRGSSAGRSSYEDDESIAASDAFDGVGYDGGAAAWASGGAGGTGDDGDDEGYYDDAGVYWAKDPTSGAYYNPETGQWWGE